MDFLNLPFVKLDHCFFLYSWMINWRTHIGDILFCVMWIQSILLPLFERHDNRSRNGHNESDADHHRRRHLNVFNCESKHLRQHQTSRILHSTRFFWRGSRFEKLLLYYSNGKSVKSFQTCITNYLSFRRASKCIGIHLPFRLLHDLQTLDPQIFEKVLIVQSDF